MLAFVELLGLLAPVAGAVVLIACRRRAPGPVALGLTGCAVTAAGSVVGLVGSRAVFLGGGGVDGAIGRLESWSAVRLALVVGGVALLAAAAVAGRHTAGTWRAVVAAGTVTVTAGAALRFLPVDAGPGHHGLGVLLALLVEAAAFGLLGLGVLLLCLAVVTVRPGADGAPEPVVVAPRPADTAWRGYRDLRRSR